MNAPVSIGIIRGDNHIIEMANEGLLHIWNKTAEVIGKPLTVVMPELVEQGFTALLDQVRITGEPFYAYEYPVTLKRHGKHEILYFDFVYKPFYEGEAEGKAAGVISAGHDVTEKVLARKKVEEVTERLNFRNALFEAQNETTPDGVLIVDARGKIILYNKIILR
jgi:PAS domain-containing protein